MRKLITLTLAAALAIGMGCAKQPTIGVDWAPAGGSRADATVSMECIYDPRTEYLATSQERVREMARERCQAWGYQDAEPFGPPATRCLNQIQGPWFTVICTEALARQAYQCIGQGNRDVPVNR